MRRSFSGASTNALVADGLEQAGLLTGKKVLRDYLPITPHLTSPAMRGEEWRGASSGFSFLILPTAAGPWSINSLPY